MTTANISTDIYCGDWQFKDKILWWYLIYADVGKRLQYYSVVVLRSVRVYMTKDTLCGSCYLICGYLDLNIIDCSI